MRWALLDEWDRVRVGRPTVLTIVAPQSDREHTDEAAVRTAIRRSLRKATEPLWRVDPLTRQERIAFRIGVLGWVVSIAIATGIDQASDDVVGDVLSQGVVLIGWVALWQPASRFLNEVLPHAFNRRRIAEFADLDVRFEWTG